MPPLCKGRWAAKRRLGGVVNPSVSFADSSLYTREPWVLPRQLDKLEFDGILFGGNQYGKEKQEKEPKKEWKLDTAKGCS